MRETVTMYIYTKQKIIDEGLGLSGPAKTKRFNKKWEDFMYYVGQDDDYPNEDAEFCCALIGLKLTNKKQSAKWGTMSLFFDLTVCKPQFAAQFVDKVQGPRFPRLNNLPEMPKCPCDQQNCDRENDPGEDSSDESNDSSCDEQGGSSDQSDQSDEQFDDIKNDPDYEE